MWHVRGKPIDASQFSPLQPATVLYEFDGPKTFTFRDQAGELCLAHWCDADSTTTRYIAVAFSDRLVAKLEQGRVSLREALEQPRAWVLDENAEGNIQSAWRVDLADLPEEVLPRSGTLLLRELEQERSAALTPKTS